MPDVGNQTLVSECVLCYPHQTINYSVWWCYRNQDRSRAQRCPLGFHEFPSRLCKQWDNGTISHPSLLASIYYIISQSLCTLQSNLSNNRCHIQKSAHLFHAVPMTTQCPQITAPSEDIHHSAESSNQSLDDN